MNSILIIEILCFIKKEKKKEYKEIIIKTYQKNKIYPHFLKSEKLFI